MLILTLSDDDALIEGLLNLFDGGWETVLVFPRPDLEKDPRIWIWMLDEPLKPYPISS